MVFAIGDCKKDGFLRHVDILRRSPGDLFRMRGFCFCNLQICLFPHAAQRGLSVFSVWRCWQRLLIFLTSLADLSRMNALCYCDRQTCLFSGVACWPELVCQSARAHANNCYQYDLPVSVSLRTSVSLTIPIPVTATSMT